MSIETICEKPVLNWSAFRRFPAICPYVLAAAFSPARKLRGISDAMTRLREP